MLPPRVAAPMLIKLFPSSKRKVKPYGGFSLPTRHLLDRAYTHTQTHTATNKHKARPHKVTTKYRARCGLTFVSSTVVIYINHLS